MKILYLIPARGGSKGIRGKNTKPLAGKPMIYYTIDAAREVAVDEDICVSTDSEEIKKIVENYGTKVPFLRPDELATDEASSEEVVKHAVDFYREKGILYELIVLLQPTSPFRTGKHIKEALKKFSRDLDMLVSVCQTKANPYYVLFEEEENGFLYKSKKASFTRRQDCPKVYELNGAIYVISVPSLESKGMKSFDKVKKYEMDKESSLDIDDPFDWKLAQIIMSEQMGSE